jgi:prepilin-type processing-associated H-X9-DG protein
MPVIGRTSGKAVVSLVLGLLSPVGLALTGVPAIVVGFLGLREVNASDGVLRGRRVAVAGMVLGGVGVLFCCGVVSWKLVGEAQARAERAACQRNLMLIGHALGDYAGPHGPYPTGTRPNRALPPDRRLSWCVTLLPGLQESSLYERIDKDMAWDASANRAAVNEPVRWFLCPAHPDPLPVTAPAYYVGLAGDGRDAAELPTGAPQAGLFGYDRRVRPEDLSRGVSPTAVVAETAAGVGPWAAGGPPTVRGLDTSPGHAPFLGPGGQFGGLHCGITHILFADGHVEAVNDGVDPEVLSQMVRIH